MIADQLANQGSKIRNRDFHPATQVNWHSAVVALSRTDDALGGILYMEKLAGGRAVTPNFHLVVTLGMGCANLTDQCGNDMR